MDHVPSTEIMFPQDRDHVPQDMDQVPQVTDLRHLHKGEQSI